MNDRILLNLIQNYYNPLTDELKNIIMPYKKKAESEEDLLFNAGIILNVLKEIGLNTTFKHSDLVKMQGRENVLLLL